LSNTNKPFGLRFVKMLTGDSANVSMRRYRIPASETDAIYLGDPVMRMTSSSILTTGTTPSLNQMEGLEYIERAAGADNQMLLGVVAGFAWNPADLTSNHPLGTVERDAFVIDDPNAIFEIQSDVTGIAYTDLGKNCLMTVTAGDATTGVSKCVATGPAADASYPLLIVGWSKDPKNDITSAAYVKILVKINNHQLVNVYGGGALGV
jgi:uncharacterized membrane protein